MVAELDAEHAARTLEGIDAHLALMEKKGRASDFVQAGENVFTAFVAFFYIGDLTGRGSQDLAFEDFAGFAGNDHPDPG
jgi:hypothetical protein